MKRHFHTLGDWRRNVLLVAAATSLGLTLPACSSDSRTDSGAEADWSAQGQSQPQSYSQGVITEMTEVQPGQWKITAERPAGKEEVAAILHHFDGKTDTLQGQALLRAMRAFRKAAPRPAPPRGPASAAAPPAAAAAALAAAAARAALAGNQDKQHLQNVMLSAAEASRVW
jgi:hypothetical protein